MAQKCILDVTINIYSMKHPIMMFDTQIKSQIVYRDFLIYFENFKFTICFKNGRVKKWSKMTYISRFSIKCFRFFFKFLILPPPTGKTVSKYSQKEILCSKGQSKTCNHYIWYIKLQTDFFEGFLIYFGKFVY